MKNFETVENTPLYAQQKASGIAFSAATLFSLLLSFAFMLVLAVTGVAATEDYLTQDWYLYANYLLPQLSFLGVIFLYFKQTKQPLKTAIRAQKCPAKYFLQAALLQVGLLVFSQLNTWFLAWLEKFGYQDKGLPLPSMDGWGFVGVFLVVAVFAAILEEIVFRGIVLDGLKSLSAPLAAIICGALFALYHQNPAQTLYQFVCGASFAFIAIRANSVFPTALSHFLNNAVILILSKFGITEYSPTLTAVLWGVSAVCLVLAILWFLYDGRRMQKVEKTGKDVKVFFMYAGIGIFVCALTWLLVLVSGM